jgi:hypothetical protein
MVTVRAVGAPRDNLQLPCSLGLSGHDVIQVTQSKAFENDFGDCQPVSPMHDW